MINVSGFDIGGTLSSSKFRVRPGQIETVTPEPSRERGVYRYCDVQFFYRGGDKARSFFTFTWRLNDRMRSIIFFYKNSSDKKLRMHSIRDFTQ